MAKNELKKLDMKEGGANLKPGEALAVCKKMEAIVEGCSLAALATQGQFERTFTLARGMQQLKAAITGDVLADILALQGSRIGFRTDKNYPANVVRECLIEAVLRGAYPVGNEFNIIAGNAYLTKEFYLRAVTQHPGITDLKDDFGIPTSRPGGAIVACSAQWKIDGVPDSIQADIPIRVNSGMGVDAILGKAARKFYKRIYDRITGSVLTMPDGDVDDTVIDATRGQVTQSRSQKARAELDAALDPPPPSERDQDNGEQGLFSGEADPGDFPGVQHSQPRPDDDDAGPDEAD